MPTYKRPFNSEERFYIKHVNLEFLEEVTFKFIQEGGDRSMVNIEMFKKFKELDNAEKYGVILSALASNETSEAIKLLAVWMNQIAEKVK